MQKMWKNIPKTKGGHLVMWGIFVDGNYHCKWWPQAHSATIVAFGNKRVAIRKITNKTEEEK